LVTVEEESRIVRLVRELARFLYACSDQISDYTAKATLEGLLRESFPHPQSHLAAVSMTHLAECGFPNTTIGSEKEFKDVLTRDPLLAYASEAWTFHARAGIDREETRSQTATFITRSVNFPALTSFDRTEYFDLLTPLHIITLYKLPMLLVDSKSMGSPTRGLPCVNKRP
jgi:hypothetical protein